MLSIYPVSLQVRRDVAGIFRVVAQVDRNLADQLRRAATSVPLNLAESDGMSGGNRRQRRLSALGSAREVVACLDVAEAMGYARIDGVVRARLDHVIGVLVRVARA